MKFLVINRSPYSIQLVIPTNVPGRTFYSYVLPSSNAIDILPWAGSMNACRQIPSLKKLQAETRIELVEIND